jgi:hypothetical protein
MLEPYDGTSRHHRCVVNLYLVVIALWSVDALINALHDSYENLSFPRSSTERNLSGNQVPLVNATGVIFILSILLGKSPLIFLFRSWVPLPLFFCWSLRMSFLGWLPGIQLTANNMVERETGWKCPSMVRMEM